MLQDNSVTSLLTHLSTDGLWISQYGMTAGQKKGDMILLAILLVKHEQISGRHILWSETARS